MRPSLPARCATARADALDFRGACMVLPVAAFVFAGRAATRVRAGAADGIVVAAAAWLDSLDPDQRVLASRPFDVPGRTDGHVVPEPTRRVVDSTPQLMGANPAVVKTPLPHLPAAGGWAAVTFARAGSRSPGCGHAYRIEASTFAIELCNTQPDAEGNPDDHVHCVWRDRTGDFDLPVAESPATWR